MAKKLASKLSLKSILMKEDQPIYLKFPDGKVRGAFSFLQVCEFWEQGVFNHQVFWSENRSNWRSFSEFSPNKASRSLGQKILTQLIIVPIMTILVGILARYWDFYQNKLLLPLVFTSVILAISPAFSIRKMAILQILLLMGVPLFCHTLPVFSILSLAIFAMLFLKFWLNQRNSLFSGIFTLSTLIMIIRW